jgi:hypothetical protein
MPTFASRVLGRSVGRPTTRHGKAPVTRRNGRRFRSSTFATSSRRLSQADVARRNPRHVRLDQGLTVRTAPVWAINESPDGALMSRFGGTRSA